MNRKFGVIADLETSIERAIRESDRLSLLTSTRGPLQDIEAAIARADALANPSALKAMFANVDQLAKWQDLIEPPYMRAMREMEERHAKWKSLLEPSEIERAMKAAEFAQGFRLPSALEQFRTSTDTLARRFASIQGSSWWKDIHADDFARASALSEALWTSRVVDRETHSAANAFLVAGAPTLPSLGDHRTFLEAAGLLLPRLPGSWPFVRSDKHKRFNDQLRANAEPQHVRKAKSLIHQYELALRDAIHDVMTAAYGYEWWSVRLPLCGCNALLARWRTRGGDVLEHADFFHYAQIMSFPEHHEAGFKVGFPDREALRELIDTVRVLRAKSHHASRHRFTPQDLRQLHVSWRQIRIGLVALLPDEDIE